MNILTKNRILQKGDEYRNNGEWKAVPEKNYGLQIQFTDYKEVRRPSETPFVHGGAPAIPCEPKSRGAETVKSKTRTPDAEKVNVPVPTPSGTGATPSHDHLASYLPTIISKKAHADEAAKAGLEYLKKLASAPAPDFAGEFTKAATKAGMVGLEVKAKLVPMTPEQLAIQDATAGEVAAEIAKIITPDKPTYSSKGPAAFPKGPIEKAAEKIEKIATTGGAITPSLIKIKYPNITHDHPDRPIWTGRNGTFTGYGLEIMKLNSGNVHLTPIGKRGGGNCAIQVPRASIPELIEFLQNQIP